MALCIECWWDLDSCRSVEWLHLGDKAVRTIGAIPFTAIDAWARRKHLDDQSFAILYKAIAYLDSQRADREASKRSLEGT